jgi:hypothetical protein
VSAALLVKLDKSTACACALRIGVPIEMRMQLLYAICLLTAAVTGLIAFAAASGPPPSPLIALAIDPSGGDCSEVGSQPLCRSIANVTESAEYACEGFAAGALIPTSVGLVPIEHIRRSHWVLAYDVKRSQAVLAQAASDAFATPYTARCPAHRTENSTSLSSSFSLLCLQQRECTVGVLRIEAQNSTRPAASSAALAVIVIGRSHRMLAQPHLASPASHSTFSAVWLPVSECVPSCSTVGLQLPAVAEAGKTDALFFAFADTTCTKPDCPQSAWTPSADRVQLYNFAVKRFHNYFVCSNPSTAAASTALHDDHAREARRHAKRT